MSPISQRIMFSRSRSSRLNSWCRCRWFCGGRRRHPFLARPARQIRESGHFRGGGWPRWALRSRIPAWRFSLHSGGAARRHDHLAHPIGVATVARKVRSWWRGHLCLHRHGNRCRCGSLNNFWPSLVRRCRMARTVARMHGQPGDPNLLQVGLVLRHGFLSWRAILIGWRRSWGSSPR